MLIGINCPWSLDHSFLKHLIAWLFRGSDFKNIATPPQYLRKCVDWLILVAQSLSWFFDQFLKESIDRLIPFWSRSQMLLQATHKWPPLALWRFATFYTVTINSGLSARGDNTGEVQMWVVSWGRHLREERTSGHYKQVSWCGGIQRHDVRAYIMKLEPRKECNSSVCTPYYNVSEP